MNTAVQPPPQPLRQQPQPAFPLVGLLFQSMACLTLLGSALLTGCGSPGSPQPPSLKLPTPPTDLAVGRSGDAVALHWTMPRRATDRVPLTGDQRVVICRSPDPHALCTPVGSLLLQPGVPATYLDSLPAPLLTGAPRLLIYTVLLQNHKERTAGPSNPAYSVAGAAPPAIRNLRAETTATGVVLRWEALPPANESPAAQPAQYLLRLHRTRIAAPGEMPTHEAQAGVPQPIEQALELPQPSSNLKAATLAQGWSADYVIDHDAALNHTYRYTVERVAQLTLDSHSVEVSSPAADPVTLAARDLFPPSMPQGLEAVADAEGRAIDLSWTPDTDPDLAGYRVYRRALNPSGSSAGRTLVSGATLLRDAAWRDASAQPKIRYGYSVTAVDASGNESLPCPVVEEELPTPAP